MDVEVPDVLRVPRSQQRRVEGPLGQIERSLAAPAHPQLRRRIGPLAIPEIEVHGGEGKVAPHTLAGHAVCLLHHGAQRVVGLDQGCKCGLEGRHVDVRQPDGPDGIVKQDAGKELLAGVDQELTSRKVRALQDLLEGLARWSGKVTALGAAGPGHCGVGWPSSRCVEAGAAFASRRAARSGRRRLAREIPLRSASSTPAASR